MFCVKSQPSPLLVAERLMCRRSESLLAHFASRTELGAVSSCALLPQAPPPSSAFFPVGQEHRQDAEVEIGEQRVAIEVELSDKVLARLAAILYELARTYAGIWYFCSPATRGIMQRAIWLNRWSCGTIARQPRTVWRIDPASGRFQMIIQHQGASEPTTELYLSDEQDLSALQTLYDLSQFTTLTLSFWRTLSDLGPLAGLTHLTELHLPGCSQVSDLSPLAGLTNLTS